MRELDLKNCSSSKQYGKIMLNQLSYRIGMENGEKEHELRTCSYPSIGVFYIYPVSIHVTVLTFSKSESN